MILFANYALLHLSSSQDFDIASKVGINIEKLNSLIEANLQENDVMLRLNESVRRVSQTENGKVLVSMEITHESSTGRSRTMLLSFTRSGQLINISSIPSNENVGQYGIDVVKPVAQSYAEAFAPATATVHLSKISLANLPTSIEFYYDLKVDESEYFIGSRFKVQIHTGNLFPLFIGNSSEFSLPSEPSDVLSPQEATSLVLQDASNRANMFGFLIASDNAPKWIITSASTKLFYHGTLYDPDSYDVENKRYIVFYPYRVDAVNRRVELPRFQQSLSGHSHIKDAKNTLFSFKWSDWKWTAIEYSNNVSDIDSLSRPAGEATKVVLSSGKLVIYADYYPSENILSLKVRDKTHYGRPNKALEQDIKSLLHHKDSQKNLTPQ